MIKTLRTSRFDSVAFLWRLPAIPPSWMRDWSWSLGSTFVDHSTTVCFSLYVPLAYRNKPIAEVSGKRLHFSGYKMIQLYWRLYAARIDMKQELAFMLT